MTNKTAQELAQHCTEIARLVAEQAQLYNLYDPAFNLRFSGIVGLLPDTAIEELATKRNMIDPYTPTQVRESIDQRSEPYKIVSYGQSSYGYDVRLAADGLLVSCLPYSPHIPAVERHKIREIRGRDSVLDVKREAEHCPFVPMQRYQDDSGDYIVLEAGAFCLGSTVETLDIPPNVLAICMGKSTYARVGLIVNVTPLEPGWRGRVTLEMSNTNKDLPIKIYINEGICQFLFLQNVPCRTTYADRAGKYMDQTATTLPKV